MGTPAGTVRWIHWEISTEQGRTALVRSKADSTWGTLGVLSCSGMSSITCFSTLAPLLWLLMPGMAMPRILALLLPPLVVLLEMLTLSQSRPAPAMRTVSCLPGKCSVLPASPALCSASASADMSMPRNFAKFFLPCLGAKRIPELFWDVLSFWEMFNNKVQIWWSSQTGNWLGWRVYTFVIEQFLINSAG